MRQATTCVDDRALGPNQCVVAHDLKRLMVRAVGELFAGCNTSEAYEIPPDEHCVPGKFDSRRQFRARAVEDDGLLREPLEHGAGREVRRDDLACRIAL